MGWGNGGLEEGWELSVCLQQDLPGAAQTPPNTAGGLPGTVMGRTCSGVPVLFHTGL